ncbi:MAG TPA: hypothetical protein VIV65_09155 [Gemmatimonadaceae bacterium]|jgi:hypothetical protein
MIRISFEDAPSRVYQRYLQHLAARAHHHSHGVLGAIPLIHWAVERVRDPGSPLEFHRAHTEQNGIGRAVAVYIRGSRYFFSFRRGWFAEPAPYDQAILLREHGKTGDVLFAFNDHTPAADIEAVIVATLGGQPLTYPQ